MSELVAERDRIRLLFMKAVFDKTQGDRFNFTNLDTLASSLGLDGEVAARVAQYLVDQGLIEWAYFGGGIAITHRGVLEIEEALRNPDRPTRHFPPAINIIHIGKMTGNIQQGTVDSTQIATMSMAPGEAASLVAYLEQIKRRRGDLAMPHEAEQELDIQIATIETQLRSTRPRRGVLSAAGEVIVELLKSASGPAAQELIRQLPAILH